MLQQNTGDDSLKQVLLYVYSEKLTTFDAIQMARAHYKVRNTSKQIKVLK